VPAPGVSLFGLSEAFLGEAFEEVRRIAATDEAAALVELDVWPGAFPSEQPSLL
jgi:hypothetical protein